MHPLIPSSSSLLSPHHSLPYLARLIVTGLILHTPSLRRLLPILPSPLSLPLSLRYFPLHPPSTATFLFNLLLPLNPLPLLSSLLLLSLPPDPFTFPILLRSLPSSLPQTHSQTLRRNLLSHPFVLNSLLSAYDPPSARTLLLHTLPHADVVSWNTVVAAYARIGLLGAARSLFDEMPQRDSVSWGVIVGGYAGRGEMDVATALFDRMPASARRNVVTWNSMVSGFAKCGLVGLARGFFDRMPERNLVSWNAMVSGYALNGEMGSAREVFELMPEKDVVSWSCMIAGYAQSGKYFEALKLFERMTKSEVEPNEITMVSVLSACAHLSALDHGTWVHAYIDKHKMTLDDDRNLGAALIDMYSKCGSVGSALEVFGSLSRKNISSWNALITGLAINGLARESLLAFEEMQGSRLKPNDITFVGVLTACTHGGLVEEGRKYLESMSSVYGIQPEMKHYGCMVDLLGRAGQLEEAERMVRRMPMKPDVMVLGALLGACRIHRDTEVAERVQKEFLKLKSQQAGCHVLLSNIYAASDRWADASKMRELLKKNRIRKEAGSSYVKLDRVG